MEREWLERQPKKQKVTEPAKCRSCGAPVLWAQWEQSGKRMPVDFHHVPDGSLVLTLRGGAYGTLLVEKYYHPKHGTGRNRYVSHFVTCPNATQHRRGDD